MGRWIFIRRRYCASSAPLELEEDARDTVLPRFRNALLRQAIQLKEEARDLILLSNTHGPARPAEPAPPRPQRLPRRRRSALPATGAPTIQCAMSSLRFSV